MPQAIIPFIPLIAAGIGSGTELGLTLSGAGQPSMPSTPAPTGPATPSGPTQDQLKSVLAPQSSNILSSDPYASSTYLSTIAPQLSGATGPGSNTAMQSVLQSLFGGGGSSFTPSGSPTNLGGLASSPGISDYMSKIASTIA